MWCKKKIKLNDDKITKIGKIVHRKNGMLASTLAFVRFVLPWISKIICDSIFIDCAHDRFSRSNVVVSFKCSTHFAAYLSRAFSWMASSHWKQKRKYMTDIILAVLMCVCVCVTSKPLLSKSIETWFESFGLAIFVANPYVWWANNCHKTFSFVPIHFPTLMFALLWAIFLPNPAEIATNENQEMIMDFT